MANNSIQAFMTNFSFAVYKDEQDVLITETSRLENSLVRKLNLETLLLTSTQATNFSQCELPIDIIVKKFLLISKGCFSNMSLKLEDVESGRVLPKK